MSKLRTLIIHPEAEARASLRARLADCDFLRVVGETVSAFEAMELLEAVPYGVVFTALDLPEGVSGMELAQMLSGRKNKPALVFLAPDETDAFKAYELEAVDYLLWPTSDDRFARTLDKLSAFRDRFKEAPMPSAWDKTRTESEAAEGDEETVQVPISEEEEESFIKALQQAWDYSQRSRPVEIEKLPINMEGRMVLVPYHEIIFIEAFEDYSYVHTATQKFLTSFRLKTLEERLGPHRFFRVHRKYLVNLDMVTEIASMPGSNFMLRTAGRTRIELPVSRRRISDLKQILGM
jgi:DNA-binding LytR/AlgR family response regulator